MVDVAVGVAASTIEDNRDGTEKKTRRNDHRSHKNTTVLLLCGRHVSILT